MSPEEQLEKLKRGAAEIISEEDLLKRLKEGKPLRVKLGLDPTAPHIHLGFAVVLRKLRQFQDFGHQVVLLIGDFTARVGDPTGRSETRKVLTPAEIEANAATYREQFNLILDPDKTEVRFNSEWLMKMNFADVIGLASLTTVARTLERDDFEKRYKEGVAIGLHEFLYPLMQGYDSVALEADVEMGGTDQKFNNLMGRTLQKDYGQTPQVVFLMPILEGTDGVQKMSKSLGNYIGITESPTEMFGKVMSIPDEIMRRYFELCTDVDMDEVDRRLKSDHPRDSKRWLGREIVSIYHGEEAAKAADEEFIRVFSKGGLPDEVEPVSVSREELEDGAIYIVKLITMANLASSNKDARRKVEQGAVSLDGEKITSAGNIPVKGGEILKVGRRHVCLQLN
ncbi:MAG TPA: tyrosine--tRNA ligase [Phycisphaerales bacterium]|nr:tyrosine--tRNA ligase [Phycisphaerales bacterium]